MSFEELRAFLAVVEQGSFFAAATALGVSRTTLRRQVDALEARTGVALLQRDRKGVVLTDAGRRLVRGGQVMEQEFTTLLRSIREHAEKPAGQVRAVLPVGLPTQAIAAVLGFFRRSWPAVHIITKLHEAPLATRLVDVDLVVWFGPGDPGPAWETHTVLAMKQRLLASRAYLATHGTPRSIEQLASHDIFAWLPASETEVKLVTTSGPPIPLQPALASADVHLLHESAYLGLGIAWAPDGGMLPQPDREPLVRVLEGVVGCDTMLRIAVPRPLAAVPKVRVIIDNMRNMLELITAPQG
jgi:DNA-binding transcriptional LysR family regulator